MRFGLDSPVFSSFAYDFIETLVHAVEEVREMRKQGKIWYRKKADGSRVTNGDFTLERRIAERLHELSPFAKLAFEENIVSIVARLRRHAISHAVYRNVFTLPEIHFGDPIDCTEFFIRGLPGWSSQWTRMRKGVIDFSVFYAPDDLGGFMCVAEAGRGTWFSEDGGDWKRAYTHKALQGEIPLSSHTMSISDGSWFHHFFTSVQKKCLAVPVVPAGLGPVLAACGKVDLSIMEPHYPHDWLHVVLLAREAKGKKVCFWRQLDYGEVEVFDQLDADALNPNKAKVGVLVGTEEMVDWAVSSMRMHLNAVWKENSGVSGPQKFVSISST